MRRGARGWQMVQNVGENRVLPYFLFLACLLLQLGMQRNPVGFRYGGTRMGRVGGRYFDGYPAQIA